ncbi:MAG: Triosephosphate isomerase [Candidatus Woesebacteria bacterium GW2011_GWB1_41_10]|uniref:Triosephosphate isomerase n=1 Tax=Candidatus Woesebacteria bacterium GW2011_GWB1_41_10 TaxID=1618577 RepID=A0A0G0XDX5_9BACT|nr:MAG: Triosephosphate isomerase [Candidatus Woesebacteria bacterium GW2011_GWB1_41_10]
MIFVNYKTYEQGTGKKAVELTRILEEVAHSSQIKIIPVIQASDVKEIVTTTTLEVWVQKIDPVEFGANTGSIIPEAVYEDGATGTFLNHSETKFTNFDELAKASDRAKEVGLKTLIFAKDLEELKNICSLNPNYVAYEPPELIGSLTTSVAQAQPEIITQAHEIANAAGTPLIVGAGVHSREDVKKSLELGAVGVAVASDILKSENPRQELMDLVGGFQ